MAKATQAGRLRGPGAAGGADPGTTNTTAAETAKNAVVAEGAAPAAPQGSSQFDATHATTEGSTPPEGGYAIAGTVEDFTGGPAAGEPLGGFVTHLLIASRLPEGFRRCGRRWGPTPVKVAIDEFSEVELERLCTERELMVMAVTAEAAALGE